MSASNVEEHNAYTEAPRSLSHEQSVMERNGGSPPMSSKPSGPLASTFHDLSTTDNRLAVDKIENHNNATAQTSSSILTNSEPPHIRVENGILEDSKEAKWHPRTSSKSVNAAVGQSNGFQGIALEVPSGQLSDEIPTDKMQFSNRGSMLIDGKKVHGAVQQGSKRQAPEAIQEQDIPDSTVRPRDISQSNARARTTENVLSMEEESLSAKVRAMYALGGEFGEDNIASPQTVNRISLRWQDALSGDKTSVTSHSPATSATDVRTESLSEQNGHGRPLSILTKSDHELAGGLEDWQDIEYTDVDRYGFIVPRTRTATGEDPDRSPSTRSPQHLQRVTTSLRVAAETPRRKTTVKRPSHTSHGEKSRQQDDIRLGTPVGRPQSAHSSTGRQSTMRSASNKLPYNKDRKLMDEAADMMTLPQTSALVVEDGHLVRDDPSTRKREIEREEKWRRMARPVPSSKTGGGMMFEFDTTNPKLIERTWKGIPDRWRATAWHAFLSTSAKRHKGSLTDENLIELFEQYQEQSSPDDVQIDIDVPRTINSHIMFRRRYRGGQRLLFRVLHAMSIHFSDTGYVQGMAALAATFLSYYEEEKAFVMLVRLWELRGLNELYKSGFGGLMSALDDFEKTWLGQGDLARKLEGLGIGPTAYGTKWYLTLFNYSVPFPAQLRVWDVFLLLGDDRSGPTVNEAAAVEGDKVRFGTTLDVLHATSAALIDGMRDILLESDFENAMKVLTSWVPIQDEDLFMRVAKVEWKMHRKR